MSCDCPDCPSCKTPLHEGTIHSSLTNDTCWIQGSKCCKTAKDDKTYSCGGCGSWPCICNTTNGVAIEDWRKHETPKPDVNDDVFQPSHYARFRVEPITFIMVNDLPFHVGNIIKYACRAGHKLYPDCDSVQSEIKDLEKVRRYAEMQINKLKGEGIL